MPRRISTIFFSSRNDESVLFWVRAAALAWREALRTRGQSCAVAVSPSVTEQRWAGACGADRQGWVPGAGELGFARWDTAGRWDAPRARSRAVPAGKGQAGEREVMCVGS